MIQQSFFSIFIQAQQQQQQLHYITIRVTPASISIFKFFFFFMFVVHHEIPTKVPNGVSQKKRDHVGLI